MFNNADAHAHPSIYVGIFLEETYVILFILSKERRNAHDHILGMENSEICPVIIARGKYLKIFKTQTQVGGHQHLSGSMNKIKQTDPHAGKGEMFF